MSKVSEAVAAAWGGDVQTVRQLLDEGVEVDARSVFQSCLLHIAAQRGFSEMLSVLLDHGASLDVLDYGGMRRTPLHWACQQGHVRCVELLVAAGADVKAQGRTWSKLVQGQKCGKMIDCHSPYHQPPEALCRCNAVRLALLQPEWTPQIHHQFPPRFREAAQLLVCAAVLPSKENSEDDSLSKLTLDACQQVLKRLAYPISAWL